ncbi:MAG: hypothetical protein COU72_03930 [Parcubacteria group bacterium CG10_big_fil_rev_8_21_14_0_10_41_35]|nr:MAG: hypothetical protein COU72_03930 [Parcubacteria group bacterium CG10_big_fil_rev_8_21_14_0_10_41_35]
MEKSTFPFRSLYVTNKKADWSFQSADRFEFELELNRVRNRIRRQIFNRNRGARVQDNIFD